MRRQMVAEVSASLVAIVLTAAESLRGTRSVMTSLSVVGPAISRNLGRPKKTKPRSDQASKDIWSALIRKRGCEPVNFLKPFPFASALQILWCCFRGADGCRRFYRKL